MAGADLSRINTNISALNALNALRDANTNLAIHQQRLATGKRINTAGDDPAGLVFAKNLESKTRGLTVARDNIGDVQNLVSTAEGGVQAINEILLTMKEKILQAASDTLGTDERTAVEGQLDALASEIDDIVNTTEWGGTKMLDGSFTGKQFQVGQAATDTLAFGITQAHTATGLGVADASLTVDTSANAALALAAVNAAITTVNSSLQDLGSTQLRVGIKASNISVAINNQLASHNRIMNADMAQEQMDLIKYTLLQQSATAMLSQANSAPQGIMKMITG
jgi:flagellin